MKTKVLGLFIFATLIITTSVSAQHPQQKNELRKRDKTRIERNLNSRSERRNFFTDEQKESLKKFQLEMAEQVKPLRNELGELEAKQHTLTTKENPDMNAIYKNIEKISDIKTEIAKIMAKNHQEIRAMLTDEQLLKFDAMKKRQPEFRQDLNQRNRMDRMQRQRFEKS